VKAGRSCINFKKIEDLKLDAAMGLVKQAAKSGASTPWCEAAQRAVTEPATLCRPA